MCMGFRKVIDQPVKGACLDYILSEDLEESNDFLCVMIFNSGLDWLAGRVFAVRTFTWGLQVGFDVMSRIHSK